MFIQSIKLFSKTNFGATNPAATKMEQPQNEVAKNNKKTAAIVGGLAALALAGTIAAVAIKRHKTPSGIKSILDNYKVTNETANTLVESVQKQAEEALEYTQRLLDEVTDLFRKGEEIAPDGTILRKITGDGAEKIMEEFSQDGTLIRKSTFIDDILDNVQEGIEEFADGSRKIARETDFYDREIAIWYKEGIEEVADESRKCAKEINFYEYGTPRWYQEGYEEFADGSRKIAKEINFYEYGTPRWYQEGYEEFTDGSTKIAREINFYEDGVSKCYQEGYEELANGRGKIAKEIYFDEYGTPRWYQEGYEELANGRGKIAKEFKLTNKSWQEVSE